MTSRTTNADIAERLARMEHKIDTLTGVVGEKPNEGLRGEVAMLIGIDWGGTKIEGVAMTPEGLELARLRLAGAAGSGLLVSYRTCSNALGSGLPA